MIVGHIFLMKYMCACLLEQLLVRENSILKQLIIPEQHMGVYHKGGGNANDRTSIFDVSHDYVKKFVRERMQCFSSQCRISHIDINKLWFKNPGQDKLSPATPSQAPLCIKYPRCYIRFHQWFGLY